jgi:hypothetical protein
MCGSCVSNNHNRFFVSFHMLCLVMKQFGFVSHFFSETGSHWNVSMMRDGTIEMNLTSIF